MRKFGTGINLDATVHPGGLLISGGKKRAALSA